MNFKSSQNSRRVKLATLGERGLESCERFTIIVIDPKQETWKCALWIRKIARLDRLIEKDQCGRCHLALKQKHRLLARLKEDVLV